MQAINRNLYMLITFAFLSVVVGGFFLFKQVPQKDRDFTLIKEEGYFIPLKIYGYCSANLPFIEVKIGNKTIPALIDLGFQGMLSLPFDLIKNIKKKKWIEQVRNYGLKGGIHEGEVYELENIKIGNMSFSTIRMEEASLESMHEGVLTGKFPSEYRHGIIGWELFSDYNLLVDCRQYILALCDSIETLRQKRYPVDAFTEAPMISNSEFLIFEAVTEKGSLRCLLDTGSTMNMLNIDLENGCFANQIFNSNSGDLSLMNLKNEDSFIFNHEDTQELSSFKIEGKEFGPITFRRIKSPIQFDAVLGMEFFDSHLIFIDFANNKVYIAPYPKETWQKPNLRPTVGRFRFHNI